jgi:hypothetical protein
MKELLPNEIKPIDTESYEKMEQMIEDGKLNEIDSTNLIAFLAIKEKDLLEMANLEPKETGLDYLIWHGPPPPTHGPRIKVVYQPGKLTYKNSFSVSIEEKPRVIAGDAKIPAKHLKRIFKWIQLNQNALLKHSRQEITDNQFREMLIRL